MADDIDFKQAMRDVRPLNKGRTQAGTAQSDPARPPSNRALRTQIQNRALHSAAQLDEPGTGRVGQAHEGQSNEDGDNSLFFLRSGVQKKVLRELKKGTRYKIEENLDLHGLTRLQAQHEIDITLQSIEPSGLQCLLIIHGKGLHSSRGAKLKEFTADYLKTCPEVKAYCSAQLRDGGSGAMYVLVKS